jgi:hypothetical protein
MQRCVGSEEFRRFGRTYRLHFRSQRISQTRALLGHLLPASFLLGLFFYLENGDDVFPPKRRDRFRCTVRYNPEEDILRTHRCENLKFNTVL